MGKKIATEELDKLFDEGHDITPYLDLDSVRRPNLETRKVNVDLPMWMITQLDREAARLSIPRQAVIKIMIDEGLERRGMHSALPRRVVTHVRVGDEVVTTEEDVSCITDERLLKKIIDERLAAQREAEAARDVKEG